MYTRFKYLKYISTLNGCNKEFTEHFLLLSIIQTRASDGPAVVNDATLKSNYAQQFVGERNNVYERPMMAPAQYLMEDSEHIYDKVTEGKNTLLT